MHFLNENVSITIKISLKFDPKGPINNILVLVQIMAGHRLGDKPLSVQMTVSLPTHICARQPQWVNILILASDLHLAFRYMKRMIWSDLIQLLLTECIVEYSNKGEDLIKKNICF